MSTVRCPSSRTLDKTDPRKKAYFNATKYTSSYLQSFSTGKMKRGALFDLELRTMTAIWLGLEIPILKGMEGRKLGKKKLILTAMRHNHKCTGSRTKI